MSLRIGVPFMGSGSWSGGVYYLESVMRALAAIRSERSLHLVLILDAISWSKPESQPLLAYADSCLRVDVAEGDRRETTVETFDVAYEDIASRVDVIFPVNSTIMLGQPHVSWIPDVQHLDMPEMFSSADIANRDAMFDRTRLFGGHVVTSSHEMAQRLGARWGDFGGRIDVLSFPAALEDRAPNGDPDEVRKRYGVAERYVICCNQLWRHKNHATLIEAFDELRRSEPEANHQLVLTGAISDYRFASLDFLPKGTMDRLSAAGALKLLGQIPRGDQIQLIRGAVALIQPSLYEGWNTGVEEGRALGKRMILSDIAVHREQNPPDAVFFPPLDKSALAATIGQVWAAGTSGFDRAREAAGLAELTRRRVEFGHQILDRLAEAFADLEARRARDPRQWALDLNIGALIWRGGVLVEEKELAIGSLYRRIAALQQDVDAQKTPWEKSWDRLNLIRKRIKYGILGRK